MNVRGGEPVCSWAPVALELPDGDEDLFEPEGEPAFGAAEPPPLVAGGGVGGA